MSCCPFSCEVVQGHLTGRKEYKLCGRGERAGNHSSSAFQHLKEVSGPKQRPKLTPLDSLSFTLNPTRHVVHPCFGSSDSCYRSEIASSSRV